MREVATGPPTDPGTVVDDKFRVERVLGEGGMGVVVQAVHLRLGTTVALKFLLPSALADRTVVERFTREARAAASLKSEHVARVIDVGSTKGMPYMVMEYLDGETVSEALKRRGRFSIEESCSTIIQACDALAEAHALGIIHRDLKPANLFLAKSSNGKTIVKVLDFGISKTVDLESSRSSELTTTTSMLGTPHYMSPEQMISSRGVDARADLWSCGVCLFRMLSDDLPFDADSLPTLMHLVLQGGAPDVRTLRPDTPPGLAALVARCLERDVGARWSSAKDLASALAPYAEPAGRPQSRVSHVNLARVEMPTRAEARPASFASTVPLVLSGAVAPVPMPVAPHTVADGRGAFVVYPPQQASDRVLPTTPREHGTHRTGGFGQTFGPPPAGGSSMGLALAALAGIVILVGILLVVGVRSARVGAAAAAPELAAAPGVSPPTDPQPVVQTAAVATAAAPTAAAPTAAAPTAAAPIVATAPPAALPVVPIATASAAPKPRAVPVKKPHGARSPSEPAVDGIPDER
jgi:eukaryotic-like serine/threonine-protein kinase